MRKKELFDTFCKMFPEQAKYAESYKQIGHAVIAIKFAGSAGGDPYSRVFLYCGPDNWQFGTKLWRKRPDKVTEKLMNAKKVEETATQNGYAE